MYLVNDSLKNIGKGASIIIIGIIISNLIGIFNQIFLGRLLGPYEYGIFNLGLSLMMMLAVLPHFGLGPALTQFIPYNIEKKKFQHIKEAFRFSSILTIFLGLTVSLIIFIFSDYLSSEIFHNYNFSIIIKAFALILPFWALHNTTGSIMQAFKKPKYYVYVENISLPIIQILTFLVLYSVGYGLYGAIIGVAFSSVFSSLAYIYIFKKKLLYNTKYVTINPWNVRKDLLSISYPLFLAGFTYLFMQYTDKIIIGIYMNPTDVGIYSASLMIASLMLFIYTAFSFNFRPIIAGYYSKRDFESIEKIYNITTRWIFLFNFPLLIYIIFFSKDILLFIFGESFISGYIALSILIFGISFNGLTGLSGETLISIRKPKLNLYSELVGAISNIILNISLIPLFGIAGAALGTALSLIFRNIVSLYFVYYIMNFNPYNSIYFRIIIVSILSFSPIFVFSKILNNQYSFLLLFPIFISIYLILVLITGSIDNNDKYLIKKSLNSFKSYFKVFYRLKNL